ncbi:MAG TPA: gluconate:H+ symporter [Puia sp.]|jgi:Gnt-I system high-affinity gluconate transporter|nr:gluconate:H+ symporter [Puia sp.]
MSFVILLAGILSLILLTTWAKLNAFLSFLLVSMGIGLANGMSIDSVTHAVQTGMGDLLGSLLVILVVGAMLGKLIADYGAAQRIVSALMKWFGRKYLVWALLITAFIVGIPLFYGIGFVLMVPLIITLSYKYNIPAVYIGLPMLASLSVTHGYLPPHPSPVALIQQYHADLGLTMLYGFIVSIPSVVIAGPLFASTLKKYTRKPLATFAGKSIPDDELPGIADSFITALLPVILIGTSTILRLTMPVNSLPVKIFNILGDASIALLLTLAYAVYSLVLKRGKKLEPCMIAMGEAVKDISLILLIIAGAGALKQVLTESGTAVQLTHFMQGMHLHPILAAWIIAAFIRVCLGSSTVAGLTAAGMIAPMIVGSNINPSLIVLATGAGSLMFSHVNDSGFWLFKEYFNLTVKETLKTWSVMETIISIVGLLMVGLIYLITSH